MANTVERPPPRQAAGVPLKTAEGASFGLSTQDRRLEYIYDREAIAEEFCCAEDAFYQRRTAGPPLGYNGSSKTSKEDPPYTTLFEEGRLPLQPEHSLIRRYGLLIQPNSSARCRVFLRATSAEIQTFQDKLYKDIPKSKLVKSAAGIFCSYPKPVKQHRADPPLPSRTHFAWPPPIPLDELTLPEVTSRSGLLRHHVLDPKFDGLPWTISDMTASPWPNEIGRGEPIYGLLREWASSGTSNKTDPNEKCRFRMLPERRGDRIAQARRKPVPPSLDRTYDYEEITSSPDYNYCGDATYFEAPPEASEEIKAIDPLLNPSSEPYEVEEQLIGESEENVEPTKPKTLRDLYEDTAIYVIDKKCRLTVVPPLKKSKWLYAKLIVSNHIKPMTVSGRAAGSWTTHSR